ncbi:hypothetical protein BD289DRAFT_85162 [Coniella lustricola]|uniref:Uncharacterized protein n=1 Tax=Coniella lustricola TaxID=2025994 RepID=A0A2T2ZZ22_9PEZI|nr:hypothetical protein BD289DRAFT_85162 [Coniella lustricola]
MLSASWASGPSLSSVSDSVSTRESTTSVELTPIPYGMPEPTSSAPQSSASSLSRATTNQSGLLTSPTGTGPFVSDPISDVSRNSALATGFVPTKTDDHSASFSPARSSGSNTRAGDSPSSFVSAPSFSDMSPAVLSSKLSSASAIPSSGASSSMGTSSSSSDSGTASGLTTSRRLRNTAFTETSTTVYLGGYSYPASLTVSKQISSPSYAQSPDGCAQWVGVEVIVMVDEVEICPDGQNITATSTQMYEILTRSICATPIPSSPCYVCLLGTPSSTDLITVTVTTNLKSPEPEPTLSVQMCATCRRALVATPIPRPHRQNDCYGCTTSSLGDVSNDQGARSDVDIMFMPSNHIGKDFSASGASSSSRSIATPDHSVTLSPSSTHTASTDSAQPPEYSAYATAGSGCNSPCMGLITLGGIMLIPLIW